MFGRISRTYDSANTFLSLGIHMRWKKRLVEKSALRPEDHVLDCATGTGDIAFLFERTMPTATITATDFCAPMLDEARKKASNSRITFLEEDVTALSFASKTFDIASIAFGIRNVENPEKALRELARVTKRRILVLEFGQPSSALWRTIYGIFSKSLLPRIGGLISRNQAAYTYLHESSARFMSGETFIAFAKQLGIFKSVSMESFFGGVVYLYTIDL